MTTTRKAGPMFRNANSTEIVGWNGKPFKNDEQIRTALERINYNRKGVSAYVATSENSLRMGLDERDEQSRGTENVKRLRR